MTMQVGHLYDTVEFNENSPYAGQQGFISIGNNDGTVYVRLIDDNRYPMDRSEKAEPNELDLIHCPHS